jgi:hypothetical protein
MLYDKCSLHCTTVHTVYMNKDSDINHDNLASKKCAKTIVTPFSFSWQNHRANTVAKKLRKVSLSVDYEEG